jgi:hypothetical protein
MLALTVAIALTAGAALVLPSRPTATADAAMPSLSVAAASARATTAAQRTHSPGRATETARRGDSRKAPATAPASASASASAAADRGGDHERQAPAAAAAAAAAAGPNQSCTLVVPAAPTSARGLTTPYRLTATERGSGACREANPDQSAFVEAAVLDLDTGALGIYHPLVVDAGSTPAFAPAPVHLPVHAVVGVWFGFNGDTLTLRGAGAGACVNGLGRSLFGQFAFCNAAAFFHAANAAIAAGRLVVPPLGTGTDGLPCPTTRDFLVVDQDQSDNLATSYRIVDGRIAQDIPAASSGTKLSNGSDEGLLAKAIDPALGCTPFTAPDLTNGGATRSPALALNELSAAAHQAAPAALVPTSDPMALVGSRTSVEKTNLYRAGVDMAALPAGQSPLAYCADLERTVPARLARALPQFQAASAPAGVPGTLAQFLATRYQATLQNLSCAPAPVTASPDSGLSRPARSAGRPAGRRG